MAPVLEELEKKHAGRLVIERVDTRANPGKARGYGIRYIPTQIFLGSDGNEVFRHTGFYAGVDIVAKWKELGYDLGAGG
jgi:thioredoxin 1